MQQMKKTLLFGAVLLVAGCVSTGEYSNVPVVEVGSESESRPSAQDSVPVYETDREYEPIEPAPATGGNSAVLVLVSTAENQTQNGDYGSAAATLERAIRISPRDGKLYYQLAQVRYLQTNYHQAEQLCRKAVSLAGGDSTLLANSRSLMAQARQAAQ